MWIGIIFVGLVMATRTLLVLDASARRSDRREDRHDPLRPDDGLYDPRDVPALNALDARAEEESAFRDLFQNLWLWAAITVSLALHVAVVYDLVLDQRRKRRKSGPVLHPAKG